MTLPRLALLLVLLLTLPAQAAAQQEEGAGTVQPLRITTSVPRLDMGVTVTASTLLEITVSNPNAVRVGFDGSVTTVREDAEGPLPILPGHFEPDVLEPGDSRRFLVRAWGTHEGVGHHRVVVSVRTPAMPAAASVLSLPARVYPMGYAPEETPPPGSRSFAVLSAPREAGFDPERGTSLQVEVTNPGPSLTLVMDVDDPEGRIQPFHPERVPVFSGQTVRSSLVVRAEPDAPRTFNATLRLHVEGEPALAQTFDVAFLPFSGHQPMVTPPPRNAEFAHAVTLRAPPEPVRIAPGGTADVAFPGLNEAGYFHVLEVREPALHRNLSGQVEWTARPEGWSGRVGTAKQPVLAYQEFEVRVGVTAPATAMPGERLVAYVVVSIVDGQSVTDLSQQVDVLVVHPSELPAAPAPASEAPAGSAPPPEGGASPFPAIPPLLLVALPLAGFAVAAAAVAVPFARREAWRWSALGMLAPLYTRLSRKRTLDHEARQTLLRLVTAEPGIHYSALKRRTGLNTGALVHHLRALEREGYVTSRREGPLRRFYPTHAPAPPPAPSGTTTPVQARVLALLDERPMTQREMAERLDLSQQGLNHHVKTLERKGLLVSERGEDGVHRWHRARPSALER